MKIVGIIGLGRVGTALACALSDRGYQLLVCSRRHQNGQVIQLEGRRLKTASINEIKKQADILFITTPDGVIGQIVRILAENEDKPWAVLHMSGSLTAKVLSPLKDQGSLTGSLHPLQSFADTREAIRNLPDSCFTYEGDKELHEWLSQLVHALAGTLQILPSSESKAIYHAGACLVSNYLVLLADMGIGCLEKAGFQRENAQKLLLPLMQGTVNNMTGLSPEKALTGPVVRGDLETVAAHIAKLEENLPEVAEVYRVLTPLLGKLALKAKGIDEERYQELLKLTSWRCGE